MMHLSLVLSFFVALGAVLSSPVGGQTARLAKRQSAQSAPHWAAYSDLWGTGQGPPDPSVIEGFNVFILSVYQSKGPTDEAIEWADLSFDSQNTTKTEYSNAGIKLMVSAFGAGDTPTTSGYDPTSLANTMANWVISNGLDGIDVDYEDFAAMDKGDGSAENWLITFTQVLRQTLPAGQYIVTHAPIAPWFSGYLSYASGAYQYVNNQVGDLIDWYHVQFYNQGSEYTTCDGLLTESSSTFPQSAVFQINSNTGVELNKIVIGKPAESGDAYEGEGYMDPNTLATCLEQAMNQGWSGGVSTWEYPDAASAWITTVRSDSWPV